MNTPNLHTLWTTIVSCFLFLLVTPATSHASDLNVSEVDSTISVSTFQADLQCASLVIDETFAIPVRCYGEATGRIEVYASGGQPPYTYFARQNKVDVDITNLAAGTYEVGVIDANGCEISTFESVQQPDQILLDLTGNEKLGIGELGLYQATTTGKDLTLTWSFEGRDISGMVKNDVLEWAPAHSGTLEVTAFDKRKECPQRATIFIELRKLGDEFFPNAFSPNGDNINDFFQPAPSDAVKELVEIRIYDRWGGRYFISGNCPSSLADYCHWNGKTPDGKDAPNGIYVYVATLKLATGEEVQLSGDLTLLR